MIPRYITLHHSLTSDGKRVNWSAIRRYHKHVRGWRDIGYHYGIERYQSGHEILIGRLMDTKGAHVYGYNDDNLGICLIGNFDIAPPPDELWEIALRLVSSLCFVLHITRDRVLGDREWRPSKTCPGKHFDMEKFRSMLV